MPDEESFDESRLHDKCTEAPDPTVYKPNTFFTTALHQTKVECTWDETPRERKLLTMRKYKADEIDKYDYKGLIASSSDESDNDQEHKKEESDEESEESDDDSGDKDEKSVLKYKKLLSLVKDNSDDDSDVQMEVSWDTGISANKKDVENEKLKCKTFEKMRNFFDNYLILLIFKLKNLKNSQINVKQMMIIIMKMMRKKKLVLLIITS